MQKYEVKNIEVLFYPISSEEQKAELANVIKVLYRLFCQFQSKSVLGSSLIQSFEETEFKKGA